MGDISLTMLSSADEVIRFESRGATGATVDVVLPQDDIYQFIVRNIAYEPGDMPRGGCFHGHPRQIARNL